jgi:hypothetical protein
VGGFDDAWDEVWIEGAVELDLDIAEVGVAMDGGFGFCGCRGIDAGGSLEWAGAVDQAGFGDARADGGARVPLCFKAMQVFDAVAHVAHAGDAAGDVQQAIERLVVGVHVEEAGKEGLARAIDDLGVGRDGRRCRGTDAGDAVAFDDHGLVGEDGGLNGFEDADVFEGYGLGMMRELRG